MSSNSVWDTVKDLTEGALLSAQKDGQQQAQGQLVIVGTGIASTRQMTIEALDWIQQADMVFYLVLDLATEAFIQAHSKKSENLHQYYGKEKPRLDTYVQMAEVMLNSVRAGNVTVGVMYGHPGVFVNPSHRAIYIAKQEGYPAQMLPGVSAEDCLYADLGIDPSTTGCTMFEATHMLLQKNRLDTRNHLIIWQAGAIGKPAMIFDNEHLHRLADYLEPEYGADYPVVAYVGAMRPLEKAKIDRITVKDLRDADVVKVVAINPCTTLYLPPKTLPPLARDESNSWARVAPLFGNVKIGEDQEPVGHALLPTSAYRMSHPEMDVVEAYTDRDKQACDQLNGFVPPEDEKPLTASPALRRAAMRVALLHHRFQRMSKSEVSKIAASEPGLTSEEQEKLRRYPDNVEAILKGTVRADLFQEVPPSVNTFAANDEVADIFEAIIERREGLVIYDTQGNEASRRLVALVR